MTLHAAIDRYIARRQAQGARFQSATSPSFQFDTRCPSMLRSDTH